MINLEYMNPEKIYERSNKDIYLIDNIDNKRNVGSAILLNGYNNISDMKSFFNNNIFNLDDYNAYFYPKQISIRYFNTGSVKKTILNQAERYKAIEELKHGIYSGAKLSLYNSKNVIIDLSALNYSFQKNIRKYKNYLWIETLERFLLDNDNTLSEYQAVFCMIPMDFRLVNFKKDFQNIFTAKDFLNIHPMTFYLNYLKTNYEDKTDPLGKFGYPNNKTVASIQSKLKNIFFVFYSTELNKFFYVKNEPINIAKIEKNLRVLIKLYHAVPLDQEEIDTLPQGTILTKIGDKMMDKSGTFENEERKLNVLKSKVEISDYIKNNTEKKFNDFVDMFGGGLTGMLVGSTKEDIKAMEEVVKSAPEDKESLEKDDTLRDFIKDKVAIKQSGMNEVEAKIIQTAKDKRASVKVTIGKDTRLLTDIINSYTQKELVPDIIDNAKILNEEIKVSRLSSLNRTYVENVYDSDIVKIFNSLENDVDNPLILINLRKENTSTELNYVDTYYAEYKNKHNKKFNVKVDIPLIIDESYFFLNGVKKSIAKQMASLPIVKNKQDRLFISSNYNKIELSVRGQKVNPKMEKFIKSLKGSGLKGVTYLERDSSVINNDYINNIEYNYYSGLFYDIDIMFNTFMFNMRDLIKLLSSKSYYKDKYDAVKYFPVGFNDKQSITYLVDRTDNTVHIMDKSGKIEKYAEEPKDITDVMIALCIKIDAKFAELLYNIAVGKSYSYTYAVVLARNIPLIALLLTQKSLLEILDAYEIKYDMSDKRVQLKADDKLYTRAINFKDTNIYYDADIKHELLLNGLHELSTSEYTFEQVQSGIMVSDYLQQKFNNRGLVKGFRSILSKMMDPITVDVANDLGYPNTIYGLMLYGNTLLSNLDFIRKNNLRNYRVRSLEIVPAHLYKVLADEHNRYIYSNGSRYTVPKDSVIKSLLSDKLVENYSILNPTFELQDGSKATWRGISGINLDEAYDIEMRSYDKTMLGFFGTYTPENANVGTTRYLSIDPKIKSVRGYIDFTANNDDFHAGNLFSIAELNSPFSPMHSDPPRQGMVVKQTEHVIPTMENTPPIIMSGGEKIMPYMLGTDFVYVAKESGKVKKIDLKNKLIILELDNGYEDVIDISEKISKNSSGGFFIVNKLNYNLKVGQKFKKNDILAKNDDYFKGNIFEEAVFTTGTLAKVALTSKDTTVEDGSMASTAFCEKIASYVTMEEELIVDTSTAIDAIVKIGDHVEVGDMLCTLTRVFDGGSKVIDMLDRLDKDTKSSLTKYATDGKKSKYSGEIIDIRIYYNHPIDEFPKATASLIKSFVTNNKDKHKILTTLKHKSMPNVHIPRVEKIEGRKIGGREIDGCIVKFYIKHKDEVRSGDKVTFQTALKTVISEVYDSETQKIYSESNPDVPIDLAVGGMSLVSRMTTDIKNLMYLQKIVVESKEIIRKIFEK